MPDWSTVRTVGTEEEAALIAGYLRSVGLEARIESLLFHQEPVTFGGLGEVRIQVPGESSAAAERALASLGDEVAGSEPGSSDEMNQDEPPAGR